MDRLASSRTRAPIVTLKVILYYRRLPSAVNRCEGIGNNKRLYRFTSCGDEMGHNLTGYGHLSSLGPTGQLPTQPRSLPSFVAC